MMAPPTYYPPYTLYDGFTQCLACHGPILPVYIPTVHVPEVATAHDICNSSKLQLVDVRFTVSRWSITVSRWSITVSRWSSISGLLIIVHEQAPGGGPQLLTARARSSSHS